MKKKWLKPLLFSMTFLVSAGISSAQNVGIGTTIPSALLEVAGGDAKINGVMIGKGGGNISSNVIAGDSALHNNTTGIRNTAIGLRALYSNKGGSFNVANGNAALFSNIAGIDNTAIGNEALFSNDSGAINTALGDWTMFYNTKGNFNTGIGGRALYNNTIGTGNSATGLSSLFNSTIGSYNSALGFNSGTVNVTGSKNTLIGAFTDVTADDLTNAGAIGYNAKVAASNSFVIGGTGADAVNVGIGIIAPVEKMDINGAVRINSAQYTNVVHNATTPVPSGGAGTIVYYDTHFFGWNGTVWKQLDN
ncbi:hypothetical protein LK994_06445 [Ferruginibacter lapsinanis]|uniref:hypothetical protein n=1 Tax=Ferruginibacter lapsinanis TaxID=563172 RepID=UPI001E338CA9|nr:hypothetical protein [Ferruginibacter lapsinanis]UEG51111.1 hypothetical protein LK994_06445 [Ferruginibacter lapsinanis]